MAQIGTPEKFVVVDPVFEPVPARPEVNEPISAPQEQPQEVPDGTPSH